MMHRPGVYKPNPVMTTANKCPAQSPSQHVSERLQQLQYTAFTDASFIFFNFRLDHRRTVSTDIYRLQKKRRYDNCRHVKLAWKNSDWMKHTVGCVISLLEYSMNWLMDQCMLMYSVCWTISGCFFFSVSVFIYFITLLFQAQLTNKNLVFILSMVIIFLKRFLLATNVLMLIHICNYFHQ